MGDLLNVVFDFEKDERNFGVMSQIMCSTDPWITLKRTQENCLASLRGDGKEVYAIKDVACKDGERVIGVIVLQMQGTFKGYLQSICIHKDYRGKGVGHKAIQFCEKRIFRESPNFFLCVSSFNKNAQKFYFDQGFKLVGEIEDFVIEGYSELLLRKSIGSFVSFKPQL